MRQVTGNNIQISANKVSIQLPLGGHSFSLEQAAEACRNTTVETVECTVLTPRTTLVPRECFDAAAAEHYLRIAGLGCRTNETAVTSDTSARIVAVMAADAGCVRGLREMFGDRVTFTSPLCGNQNYSEPTVWLHRTGDLIYIKIYRPVLRLAEALEISSDTDVLQLLYDLRGAYDADSCTIVCSGERCEHLRRKLAKYYRHVKCE